MIRHRLDPARRRTDELANRRVFRLPLERIHDLERRLTIGRAACSGRRSSGCAVRERVVAAAARLESLSPLNVLARGYSLTLHRNS